MPTRPLNQVIELTGSESPSAVSWNSKSNRARQDLSRARLKAIESSLENGRAWVPPSPSHRKTWEEEVNHFFNCSAVQNLTACQTSQFSLGYL